VSSLSDRSDNSEGGAASGEESPGILSDDQPPESPSDSNDSDDTAKNLPWMKSLVKMIGSFNFYCAHQNFCHPYCYRRHMRASSRLVKAVRKVRESPNREPLLLQPVGSVERFSAILKYGSNSPLTVASLAQW
jgi:Protein UNC80